jgi:hypothetical protein
MNVNAFDAGGFDSIVTDSAGCWCCDARLWALFRRRRARRGGMFQPASATFRRCWSSSACRHHGRARLGGDPGCRCASAITTLAISHAQGVRKPPRQLLRALPGVELVDLPNSDWCCGSAGVYNLTHPDMANAQLARKLDSIERSGAEVVVASNPGCQLHMERGGKARGLAARMMHLVELLGRAYPAAR